MFFCILGALIVFGTAGKTGRSEWESYIAALNDNTLTC
jgi:hypothetical protein